MTELEQRFQRAALLGLAVQDTAVEVEVFGVELVGQVSGDTREEVITQIGLDGRNVGGLHLLRHL